MITENWCIIKLDREDWQKGKVNGGLEQWLPANTSRVRIITEGDIDAQDVKAPSVLRKVAA